MKLSRLLPLFAMMGLGGCMTTVETQVDAYSAIPAELEPKTVYIAPYENSDAKRLEWQTNAQKLAGVLSTKGFTTVSKRRDASLIAFFGFNVDQGERVQSTYSIPQYGVTGYSGANTYGNVYGNSYTATTTLTPTYGVTGYQTGTSTDTIFTRSMSIDMVDSKTGKQVFEAKAVSRGSCNSFAPIANQIIGAALSDFPKGKTGKVSLPSDAKC